MSGAGRVLFGQKSTPSQVVDTTPHDFAALRSPFAAALQHQISNPAMYNGPFAAGITDPEMAALGQISGAASQVGNLSGAGQFGQMALLRAAGGGNGSPFTGFSPISRAANSNLLDIINGGQQNPYIDQLVASAQRPILNNFSDAALAARGLYTGAGQQVQGQGSSPFAMASARLAENTTGALNDASTSILNNAFNTNKQAQLTGLNLAGSMQSDQQNRQVQAGQALQSNDLAGQQAQLQAQLQNLQSQGLPRLIQQYGIDAGLKQFNDQQAQLLQLMQTIGGVTAPSNAVLPGMQGTPGAFQEFMGGLGSGIGSSIGHSDRRLKKDIAHAGTTPNGLNLYRFRYAWQPDTEPLQLGVMADEIEKIIPDAVSADRYGMKLVDYSKVFAHG